MEHTEPQHIALQHAIAQHQAGRLQEAGELYLSILEGHPNHPDVNFNMGVLAVQMKQPAAGLPYFLAALEADPSCGQYWTSYIDALIQSGQMNDARQVLTLARKQGLQGDDADALTARFEKPSSAAAKPQTLESVMHKTPDHHEINALVALFNSGQLVEAARAAQSMTVRFPSHEFGWKALGTVYQHLGKIEDALVCMQKAVALSPGDAEAHNNLGNILNDLGRKNEAETSLRRALKINPGYADAHCNLGATLQDLGRPDEAEASYRQALQIRPDLADAHYNLGNTLKALGKLNLAEDSYRKSLKIKPDYAQALNNLGVVLLDLNRLDESLDCLQRALQINPDNAEAHFNLGNTLNDLGQTDKALASYQQALKLKPDLAEALVAIGKIDVDAGRFAEADAMFQRALALKPEMPEAWAELAGTRKMTTSDADWMATAEKIVRNNLTPRLEYSLRYAMGKYCDDIHDFDRAFQNFHRANELKKMFSKRYDRQQWTSTVDYHISNYHHELVTQVHKGASSSERPLFIVGMPRSGTSLIEQIIASHQEAFGAGELHFWSVAAIRLDPDAELNDLNETMRQTIAKMCLDNLAGFSSDALRVVDKMPGNFLHLGLIHTVFPNARILHAQRNPIDTCLSIYFQNFNAAHTYANDLNDLAHYYKEYLRLMAHWRNVLPAKVFLDVPYEELVEDHQGWSRKIIKFIGLDWDERCLNFNETERRVSTSSNWQVRQKIYKSSKERWRNYEKYVAPLLELRS